MTRTVLRTCPLCEATCGLELTLDGEGRVTRARGDAADPFSRGYLCAKGASLGQFEHDPQRLRAPLLRGPDGRLREAGWPEAFAEVERRLAAVIAEHGRDAVAVYTGNPVIHALALPLYLDVLARSFGTRNLYSSKTLDIMPKSVSCGLMFGDPLAFPVPDVDRTDYLLVLGANPMDSNGSLWTVPDLPARLRALRNRGGRLVVVDPRRTRTADRADRHLAVRPGTDGYLLFGIVHTLFAEGLVGPPETLAGGHVTGVGDVERLAAGFPPEVIAPVCGVGADDVRLLARELAAAPAAAVYGRLGTSTTEFGTLTSWLVDVVNVLTGNLDRPGGAMFGQALHATRRPAEPYRTGRWHSRVRGLPETSGELPTATLADEIETPGEGQVRALVCIAGNPVLAAPNGERLDRLLPGLGFMVSVDPYLNETSRHAHVVLPPPRLLQTPHYDVVLGSRAVRRFARYSPAAVALDPGQPSEAEIVARLALAAAGRAGADPAAFDDGAVDATLAAAAAAPGSPLAGRRVAELRGGLTGGDALERRLDLMLRLGPYGDAFGARPGGLSLRALLDAPHGVDLGPLVPRLPGILATASGTVELCPAPLAADVARLRAGLAERREGLVLVTGRQPRGVNSWSHNWPALAGGSTRCVLRVNPADAARLGLADGAAARVTGRHGAVEVPVEVTDRITPGVVALPYGWGHGRPGTRLDAAAAAPGVSVNALTDHLSLDPLSGTPVFNGLPVRVERAG